MEFWKMAYDFNWVTAQELKGAVKTDTNPFGEITPEQYQEITQVEFTK